MATQTLVFLFAGTGGPAAMPDRLGEARPGLAAGDRRLIRMGLAGHDR